MNTKLKSYPIRDVPPSPHPHKKNTQKAPKRRNLHLIVVIGAGIGSLLVESPDLYMLVISEDSQALAEGQAEIANNEFLVADGWPNE